MRTKVSAWTWRTDPQIRWERILWKGNSCLKKRLLETNMCPIYQITPCMYSCWGLRRRKTWHYYETPKKSTLCAARSVRLWMVTKETAWENQKFLQSSPWNLTRPYTQQSNNGSEVYLPAAPKQSFPVVLEMSRFFYPDVGYIVMSNLWKPINMSTFL